MNREAARKACRFFEEMLHHSKGEFDGQAFHLLPWERDFIGRLFGTLRPDGLRQYRTAYVEIPRKNGKALAIDTPIITPRGWTLHGDLIPGDQVFNQRGEIVTVQAVTAHYEGPVMTLRLAGGELDHGPRETRMDYAADVVHET